MPLCPPFTFPVAGNLGLVQAAVATAEARLTAVFNIAVKELAEQIGREAAARVLAAENRAAQAERTLKDTKEQAMAMIKRIQDSFHRRVSRPPPTRGATGLRSMLVGPPLATSCASFADRLPLAYQVPSAGRPLSIVGSRSGPCPSLLVRNHASHLPQPLWFLSLCSSVTRRPFLGASSSLRPCPAP